MIELMIVLQIDDRHWLSFSTRETRDNELAGVGATETERDVKR